MPALVAPNRCAFTTTTTGTGSLAVGPAVQSYDDPALAGVQDNDRVFYSLVTTGGLWECGVGRYQAGGPSMERVKVLSSSSGGAAINLPAGTHTVTLCISEPVARASQEGCPSIGWDVPHDYLTVGVDNRSLRLGSGWAFIEGIYHRWTAPIDLILTNGVAPLNAQNQLIYIYLYSAAGTPTLEVSTTAPETDMVNNYLRKTGDASRRLVGWARTGGEPVVGQFYLLGMTSNAMGDVVQIDHVLSGPGATSPYLLAFVNMATVAGWTAASLASIIPLACHVATVQLRVIPTVGVAPTVGIAAAQPLATMPYQWGVLTAALEALVAYTDTVEVQVSDGQVWWIAAGTLPADTCYGLCLGGRCRLGVM